jgi:hypothetical protein
MFARSAVQYALGFAVCQACNTTYCGSFLGQSQDVELCRLWKNEPLPINRRMSEERARVQSITTRTGGRRLSTTSRGCKGRATEGYLSSRRLQEERGRTQKSKRSATV